jgi:hypothetical protein
MEQLKAFWLFVFLKQQLIILILKNIFTLLFSLYILQQAEQFLNLKSFNLAQIKKENALISK